MSEKYSQPEITTETKEDSPIAKSGDTSQETNKTAESTDAKPPSKPDKRFRSTEESKTVESELKDMAEELANNSQSNEQFTDELVSIADMIGNAAPELTQGGLNRAPQLSQKVTMSRKAGLRASQKIEKELLISHAKEKGIERLKEKYRELDLLRSFGDVVRKPRNASEFAAVKVAQTHLSPGEFREAVTNKQKNLGTVLGMAQNSMIQKVNRLQQRQQQTNKQHNASVAHQPHHNFLSDKVGLLSSLQQAVHDMVHKPSSLSANKGALGSMHAPSTPSAAKPAPSLAPGLHLNK